MAKRPTIDQLLAQISELTLRVQLLESRVRAGLGQARRPALEVARRSRVVRRSKGRNKPRCPGCLLELPVGHHASACVWCGFRFEAARPITLG